MTKRTLKLHEAETPTARVLVVDDHAQARDSVAFTLKHAGYTVQTSASAVEALKLLERETADVIVTDLKMPGMTGIEFLAELKRRNHPAQVILVTAYATVETAVDAMRRGAFDFLEKPFALEALEELVGRAARSARCATTAAATNIAATADELARRTPAIIGTSPQMQALRVRMVRAAATEETVLITGESGTGKELVARAVHNLGARADRPFVGLNCPAMSAQLMESELFGHERGAFTGAEARRAGRFEAAAGGSILLDEVTELDLPLQAKLLRVLQERTFERVGSSESIAVEARVLATTNRDLRQAVADGKFREDLYYRLAVIPLAVPPLRERAGDVPQLLDHFLQQAAERLGAEPAVLSRGARDMLGGYRWPGNVRELQNLMTRATVLGGDGPITADDLRPWLNDSSEAASTADQSELPVGLSLQEMERRMIEATLRRHDGHRARTAEALGIGLRTLTAKIKEYGYVDGPRRSEPPQIARAG
ncbi:MAG: sigma-54-dependent Fis family transcriptional regulator [Planctomycetales bacterium]|nr:sigma-54-dependent Fis family transcriptional regulator [Planctomycetales bacterium]MBN8626995.1 sigma-54-dependent Fis family transcriptional regulator [Planctomycetota bacterium]